MQPYTTKRVRNRRQSENKYSVAHGRGSLEVWGEREPAPSRSFLQAEIASIHYHPFYLPSRMLSGRHSGARGFLVQRGNSGKCSPLVRGRRYRESSVSTHMVLLARDHRVGIRRLKWSSCWGTFKNRSFEVRSTDCWVRSRDVLRRS